jgi:xylulokinase
MFFVPHMQGERSPYYDHRLSGAFIGLRTHHDATHIVRAIMEGVAFNVRAIGDDIIEQTGEPLPPLRVVGGGANSPTWRSIFSAVLATPLDLMAETESTTLGAAILAAVGAGDFKDVVEACDSMVHVSGRQEPDAGLVDVYQQLYSRFSRAGEAVRKLSVDMAE